MTLPYPFAVVTQRHVQLSQSAMFHHNLLPKLQPQPLDEYDPCNLHHWS